MLPAIGSLSALSGGRTGLVVAARPLGEPEHGRQLVALQVRTVDRRDAQGQAANRVSGLAPLPAEAVERPLPSRALRSSERSGVAQPVARLPDRLSAAENAEVVRLRQRDAQVRQEETTHAALAGDLAGPISYVYETAPDGRRYAVGGSLAIRAETRSGDPRELERLGAGLAAAALAPVNPSAQDYATARLGHRLYAQAGIWHQPPARTDLVL